MNRLLGWAVVMSIALSSCRSVSIDAAPTSSERLRQIRVVVLEAPVVTVTRRQLGDDDSGAAMVGPSPLLPILPAPPPPTTVRVAISESNSIARNVVQAFQTALRRHPTFVVTDDRSQADASLHADVVEQYTTAGRQAVGVLETIVVGWPFAVLGTMGVTPFRRVYDELLSPVGMTKLELRLVDRPSGDVLWRYRRESRGGFDLRRPDSAQELFDDAIRELSSRR